MLVGQLNLDQFEYEFFNGQVQLQAAGEQAPVPAKILRIDSMSGVVVAIPFRGLHWPTFQEKVAGAGDVQAVETFAAGALGGLPTMDEIIRNARNGR